METWEVVRLSHVRSLLHLLSSGLLLHALCHLLMLLLVLVEIVVSELLALSRFLVLL